MISPAADPIIAALLNELDIEYDGRNSWTNRAYVRLTARELEADCYHTPAYPELGEVIKTRAPKAIRAATETALEDFDAEQLLESRRTQSTQSFYSLSNQAEPCFRSFLTDQAIEEFFKEVNSVTKAYPELSFACDLLRLDLLLWQERMEDISPLIERLKQQADQSWIKWRDLANVFVQGANRNRRFPREHAIEAAETALSLARHDYCQNLIRLCISAYDRQSNHPRVNALKADSRYSGIENPFLIGIPKAFPQRSLPPSTRVPTPSPIGEP